MNFDLTDEQRTLQDVLRRFCRDRLPVAVTRTWGGQKGAVDRERWRQLAGLGTFWLLDQASGGSPADAAVAYEVLGENLVSGPLLGASLAAPILDGAGEGEALVGVVDRASITIVVPHLAELDALLVLGDAGVNVIDPSALDAIALDAPLDATSPAWLVAELPDGSVVGDAALATRLRHAGSLLVSGLLVGISREATARAVEHARDRHQFGRPIGSFQAVKHLLADCVVRTELAEAALFSAAVLGRDEHDAPAIRSMAGARHLATEAAVRNAKIALQVFGGMGFTWEVDAHLFVRRAWSLASTLGSDDEALDRIAGQLFDTS